MTHTNNRYAKFNDIKLKNPTVKTLLAVGGWNMGSKPFTQMVKTPESRAEFTKSTIKFLRERNFDGLDLDWEYPANRGSPKEDKDRFTKLVIVRVFLILSLSKIILINLSSYIMIIFSRSTVHRLKFEYFSNSDLHLIKKQQWLESPPCC